MYELYIISRVQEYKNIRFRDNPKVLVDGCFVGISELIVELKFKDCYGLHNENVFFLVD